MSFKVWKEGRGRERVGQEKGKRGKREQGKRGERDSEKGEREHVHCFDFFSTEPREKRIHAGQKKGRH